MDEFVRGYAYWIIAMRILFFCLCKRALGGLFCSMDESHACMK